MNTTIYGRRAVASPGFKKDVRRILRDSGTDAAIVFTALVLCANANGVGRLDEDALARFCNSHAPLLEEILNDAVSVN